MLIFLVLNIVNGCEYNKILECLQKGSSNTECVDHQGCVLSKVERIISSHQLKITGFIIEPLYYSQMAAHSKCDLETFDSCFVEQDSIGVLDCVTQRFCIEYVNIDHLSENIVNEHKEEEEKKVSGEDQPSEKTNLTGESEVGTQELTEIYKDQVAKKLETLFEKVRDGFNQEDSQELLEKLEKINEELDIVQKELEVDKGKLKESSVNESDHKARTDSQEPYDSLSETFSTALPPDESNNSKKLPQTPDSSTPNPPPKAALKSSTTCSEDCDQLCDTKSNPALCISNCLTEFCQAPQTPSSDYLSVILTGIVLFLIVFILFLFLQNKSMRSAIENGDFGIAIYSSI